jgi:hypothetical protein
MTTIIRTHFKKKKPKKLNAKQRELQAEWESLLKKYHTSKKIDREVSSWSPPKVYIRETPIIPSLNSGHHDCTKKESPVYTGTKVKGIGTMHKSNAVPIFSDEEAVEISKMRRG